MVRHHYLLQSKNNAAKVYEYYKDIMSYPRRYPAVYGSVKEVNKTLDNAIDVEILLPLEKPSENDPFTTRFTFLPPDEIRYEVINGYGKGKIKNSINIKEPGDSAIRKGCKCEVEVNHLPLDIMKVDPQLLDLSNSLDMTYLEMVGYLSIQDQIYLEGNENLDEVRDCVNCGETRSVRPTGAVVVEANGKKKTVWFRCEKCGKESRHISVKVSDHVGIQD